MTSPHLCHMAVHRHLGCIRLATSPALLTSQFTYLFFFFQAEDGIRDLTVTGVQTCALPISDGHVLVAVQAALVARELQGHQHVPVRARRPGPGRDRVPDAEFLQLGPPGPVRSEERRVGKEGRSRWSPYH